MCVCLIQAHGYGNRVLLRGIAAEDGIANLAREMAREKLEQGIIPGYCTSLVHLPEVNAEW